MTDFLRIDVSGHTEKKGALTYLSWCWAWAEVLKIDPEAMWEPVMFGQPDGTNTICLYLGQTALVQVRVTIKGKARGCMLPVMDHRNKAIPSPDAFAVNTAIQRCLVKAIAMHGLGLYIYAGEDLPEGDEDSLVPALEASIEQAKQKRQGVMGAALNDVHLDDMTKVSLNKLARRVAPMDPAEAYQVIEDNGLNGDEKIYLWSLLESKLRSALKREKDTRALMSTKETA